jgi:Leucine-rich repeat (LRR) protein
LTGHGLTAKEVPAAVWGMARLTTLDLASNKLECLAPEVGQLTNLKTLKLDHNRCEDAPSFKKIYIYIPFSLQ